MKRLLFSLLMTMPLAVFAQKVKTVEGAYTYHAPENITIDQAKRTALERAKIQALAETFGTVVSQYNTSHISNTDGQSSTDFSSIGSDEVKGEWIETIGTPSYDIAYENSMLVISCSVKGKAREIVSSGIDVRVKLLCNGIEDKFESDRFRNGDDLYLSFQAPVAGYLAVYLVDDNNQAYCLLPYRNQTTGIYPVKANRHYVFFHEKSASADDRSLVDEYTMTCERQAEHNQLYIIFSPTRFTKAIDKSSSDAVPRELSFGDFQQWLVKCRKHDADMVLKTMPIEVER